jgi:hypothetical protein
VFEIAVPTLQVTSPVLRQTLLTGTTHTLRWRPTGFAEGSTVKVDLSRNGGQTWTTLLASTPNDGSEDINVPTPASANALLRLTAAVPGASPAVGLSRAFSISQPTLTVVRPRRGEQWFLGSQGTVTWTGTTVGNGTVTIELSRDGGTTWEFLAEGIRNDGGESVGVTGTATRRARVRVTWTGSSGGSLSADNAGNFSITRGRAR